ncbi:MAG TPA: hypothetical protein VM053_02605 [Gemmatimonadaceae bacterium]|nr:hypothetical protein [Gemmatimonadaceae bacterium]
MQTQQAPAAPGTPAAPAATAAPPAPAAPAPGTITIVGADGVTKTIVLPGGTDRIVQRAAERAAERAQRGADPRGSDEFAQGMAAGVALSLVVFTLLRFWQRYKRRGTPSAAVQASPESPQRLERMERGIEAIAIEVERISEGQRFVTSLLAESRQPAIAEKK